MMEQGGNTRSFPTIRWSSLAICENNRYNCFVRMGRKCSYSVISGDYDMDGYQYEKRCAQFLEENGFSDISVTPGSGDQGIDIIAHKEDKKYGVQCKYYTGSVGNKAIQEAYAGAAFYSCDVAMVITNAKFSKPAEALAQKLGVELHDGVDAIALFESSKFSDTSEEDRERLEVEKLEKQLQARYQALQAKFPQNDAKDKEIATQAEKMIAGVTELMRRFEERSDLIYAQMRWESFRSTRDPKFLSYKRQLKENCLFYDELIKERLEAADKYASQCVSSGVSEGAALKLVGMISCIYDEGGFSVEINGQMVAQSKWLAKHIKIYEKWMAYKEGLPSKIQERDSAEEARELRYAKENLNAARKRITKLREEIRVLEEKAANEADDLIIQERTLGELGPASAAAKEKVSAAESERRKELAPIEKRSTVIKKEISALTTRRSSSQKELAEASLFAFGKKKELKDTINTLTMQIESLTLQQSELGSQIEIIKLKHDTTLSKLKQESKGLDRKRKKAEKEIEKIKERLESKATEKEIGVKKREIKKLKESLPALESQVKNIHKHFLQRRLQS